MRCIACRADNKQPAFAALRSGEGKKERKTTMKKLLIALAAVAVAAGAQAASFSWKTSATGKVYNPGTTDLLASATAYLFDANAVSQGSLVTAFAAGSLDLSSKSSLSSKAIASGAIGQTSFTDGTAVGDTLTAYFATIVSIDSKDYLFISDTVSQPGVEGKTTGLSFNAKTASQAAALDASKGYSVAGWYAAPTGGGESVPEPTSGLLMLIGAAGLALRRKRA